MNNDLAIQRQLTNSPSSTAMPYILLFAGRILASQLAKNTLPKSTIKSCVLSEIKFKTGTHHLLSPNKKYSQQLHLESIATFVNQIWKASCKPALAWHITCRMNKYLDFHLQLMKFSSFSAWFLFLSVLVTLVFLKDPMYLVKVVINGVDSIY